MTTDAERSAGFGHFKPIAGEPEPPNRYLLLLGTAAVGGVLAVVGIFAAAWLALAGITLAIIGVAAFVFSPSPITANAWNPPKAPAMEGVLAPNTLLGAAEVLVPGQVNGPEDIAVSPDGKTVYASSYNDGGIVRIDVSAGTPQAIDHAHTGGSPVDIELLADGSLLVCDWRAGLLRVDTGGQISTILSLGALVDGRPFVRPDGVTRAGDGTIYLTEGSARPGMWSGVFEGLEGGSYGRVIAFDPPSGAARTVVDGLSFANGISIEPGGRFLVVSDQYRYQIKRLWLTGERAGEVDTFAENLPGFPHNIHFDAEGILWVGLYQLRNSALDAMGPRPRLKQLIAKLPRAAVEGPDRIKDGKAGRGGVVALGPDGEPICYLAGPPSRVDTISAVQRHGDTLYVSTLTGDAILRLPVPLGCLRRASPPQ